MSNQRKGISKEESEVIKNNISIFNKCTKCNEVKNYNFFPCKKYKDLYYFSNECNKCTYIRKISVHEGSLQKYVDNQKYKENYTVAGRATMLRNRCKQRSKIYKMEYNLTKDYIYELLEPRKCAKTGIDLIIDDSKYNPYAPSIDRIDSNKGYTEDNIQMVCLIYNFCKNQFTEEQVDNFLIKCKINDIYKTQHSST